MEKQIRDIMTPDPVGVYYDQTLAETARGSPASVKYRSQSKRAAASCANVTLWAVPAGSAAAAGAV